VSASRLSVLAIAGTLLTAVIGGWVGVTYGLRHVRPAPQLDDLVHTQLHLSRAQNEKLIALENGFAAQRALFETQIRAANRDIAAAITVRHQYDAGTQEAVERLNNAVMGLQRATIEHVIAMRALLSSDQVSQFDSIVNQALVVAPP
jgi:hypothetical protein